MRVLKISLGVALGLLLVMQFIPVSRANPPVTGEIVSPPEVQSILETSCYDCHSNETTWPWYAKVAPMKFVVAHHVEEARDHLNFSTWDDLDGEARAHAIHEIWEEVGDDKMPLPSYLRFHPEARITESGLDVIRAWARDRH